MNSMPKMPCEGRREVIAWAGMERGTIVGEGAGLPHANKLLAENPTRPGVL